MSAATLVARGRAAAEALMVDACEIKHVTGMSTDPDTGVQTPTKVTVYAGKARIQQPPTGGVARPDTVGEAQVYQMPLTVQLPMSATGISVGDRVTCTASVLDPDLVGRSWWVRELAHKTHSTARRVGCEEVTS